MQWWNAVARYPATWVALVIVLVVEWSFFAAFDPPGWLTVLALLAGVVAVLAWLVVMSATGTLARLQFALPEIDAIDPDELAVLRAELEALADPRPLQQLHAVTDKRNNLESILEHRLDEGELTFARYLSTAQHVYRATLDNLHEVAVAIRSISAIDDAYITTRLAQLGDLDDEPASRERESLTGRRQLAEGQARRIANLMAQNEAAMTAIDRTATALADAPIGRAPADAEAAMAALGELAERASRYATR